MRSPRSVGRWMLGSMLVFVVLTGCAAPAPSLVPLGPDIAVPVDELRPIDRCTYDAGFRVTAVHPGRSGSNAVYSWDVPTSYTWEPGGPNTSGMSIQECGERFSPPDVPKTVAELREIYDRWILERECLIRLGFKPREPTTFTKFVQDWTTGPWSPVNGIPLSKLRGDARDQCGLEMIP